MWMSYMCRERLNCRLTAKKLAQTGRYDAIVAIGCVLRGETAHYDYVCSETARGLQLAQMDTGVPVMFCVLTCDTLEQAIDRAGLKGGNKGFEAGLGAVEMAQLSRKLRAAPKTAAPAQGTPKITWHSARNPRICHADAVSMGHEPAGSTRLEARSGKAQRPRRRRALSRISYSKAPRTTPKNWTKSSRNTQQTGDWSEFPPSTAPFCAWRCTRCAPRIRRQKW